MSVTDYGFQASSPFTYSYLVCMSPVSRLHSISVLTVSQIYP